MVDLADAYVILNITIYNRGDTQTDRTSKFSINVGNSSDVNQNTAACYYRYEPISSGGHATMTCITHLIGRYVSIVKDPGYIDSHMLNFCEVVIMGYRHIDCSSCPSSCNDLTGCETCPAGKMRPACDCNTGRFGVDCGNTCHCYASEACDPINGRCPNGCQDWFMLDSCSMEISTLNMSTSVPIYKAASLHKLTIQFTKPSVFDGRYYSYDVEYRTSWSSYTVVESIPHNSYGNPTLLEINNLSPDSEYIIRVVPYSEFTRPDTGQKLRRSGTPSQEIILKTLPAANSSSTTSVSTETRPAVTSSKTSATTTSSLSEPAKSTPSLPTLPTTAVGALVGIHVCQCETTVIILGAIIGVLLLVIIGLIVVGMVLVRRSKHENPLVNQPVYYNKGIPELPNKDAARSPYYNERAGESIDGVSPYAQPDPAYSLQQVSQYEELPPPSTGDYEQVN